MMTRTSLLKQRQQVLYLLHPASLCAFIDCGRCTSPFGPACSRSSSRACPMVRPVSFVVCGTLKRLR